jgi:hypothetical protein
MKWIKYIVAALAVIAIAIALFTGNPKQNIVREAYEKLYIGQRSFPMPLLVLLIAWLTIVFSSFGLLAPRNTAVVAVLFVCALAAASGLFLILELDQPFGGLIKVSSAPLQSALVHIGR